MQRCAISSTSSASDCSARNRNGSGRINCGWRLRSWPTSPAPSPTPWKWVPGSGRGDRAGATLARAVATRCCVAAAPPHRDRHCRGRQALRVRPPEDAHRRVGLRETRVCPGEPARHRNRAAQIRLPALSRGGRRGALAPAGDREIAGGGRLARPCGHLQVRRPRPAVSARTELPAPGRRPVAQHLVWLGRRHRDGAHGDRRRAAAAGDGDDVSADGRHTRHDPRAVRRQPQRAPLDLSGSDRAPSRLRCDADARTRRPGDVPGHLCWRPPGGRLYGLRRTYATGRMREIGCWAHARRGFVEALTTDVRAALMVALIQQLYQVERAGADLDADAHRDLRHAESMPLLVKIAAERDQLAGTVLPKSPLGDALRYLTNQWAALQRFVEDGRLAIDNNRAENQLRVVAVGRKNWLFAGSMAGAHRAALLYSLVQSCKLVDVPPFAYLKDILLRVATHPQRLIGQVTPKAWADTFGRRRT